MQFFSLGGGTTGAEQKLETGESDQPSGRRKGGYKTEFRSYYGRQVVKKAHWSWEIWLYFWLGGIAGGASAITALFEIFGNKKRDRSLIQAGRYVSLAGLAISPVLLIMDLGRPERFHHMLRIVKFRSPLNMGTYFLSLTGALSGLNAARQVVEDGLIPENSLPGQLALLVANPFTQGLQGVGGLAVGSYTGVLLSATATPLWAEADTTMGPIFLATALSNGAAAISLARTLTGSSNEDAGRLDEIEQIAMLSEMGLIAYTAFKMNPQVRRVFVKSAHSKSFLLAVLLGQVIPFLVQLLSGKNGTKNKPLSALTSLMVLAGGFLLRYAIVEGGKATVEDPAAYHAITRGKARPTPAEQAAMSAKSS